MKKASKKYFLSLPIFPVDIYLIVTEDIVSERIKMRDTFGPLSSDAQSTAYSLCAFDNGNIGLFINFGTDHGVIAHEIYHLTNRVMEYIGCQHSHKYSEEAYAYLLQWITNWVYSKLERL